MMPTHLLTQWICLFGFPCLAAGLATSMKRAPNRTQMLKAVYEEEFQRAMTEDRDRASFNVVPQYEYFRVPDGSICTKTRLCLIR